MANSDVTVIIDIQKPTFRLGFGKPLIIGSSADGLPYTTYADLEAVGEDFTTSSEVYKAATALFGQGDHSPAEIAVMLHKTVDETLDEFLPTIFAKDWYFLVATSSEVADIIKIADAVELDNTRQYFVRSSNIADLATIKAKGYTRTTVMFHTDTSNYPEAAWIGETGSDDVGSTTWKFKTLQGIVPLDLTATELNEIHSLGANTYVLKAGQAVTSEGKVVSGEYIDIIHSKDFVSQTIQFEVQKLLNQSRKISYDDSGIALIESTVRTVLQRAFNNGMIASDDSGLGLYSTSFLTRSQTTVEDRMQRKYKGGEFTFELAGAIHETTIKGFIKL